MKKSNGICIKITKDCGDCSLATVIEHPEYYTSCNAKLDKEVGYNERGPGDKCPGECILVCIPAPDAERRDKLNEAKDAVIEAAREALPHLIAAGKADSYSDPDIGLSNAESRLKRALAALDEVRGE